MTNRWIMRPGQSYDLTKFEALGAELRAEIARIEALGDAASCRLCGNHVALTEEHTPSKRAGNVGRTIRGVIDDAATDATGTVTWQAEIIQGITHKSLCADCNSKTGSWYNPSYVRLTRLVQGDAEPRTAGQVVVVDVGGVSRQRVAKQALTTIVATCQSGLTAAYPDLRSLLISIDA